MSLLLTRQNLGLVLGPSMFVIMQLIETPPGISPAAMNVASVAVLMTIWWISEAVPIAVTALLPIVLFPALGVMSTAKTTIAYANHLIYLFLGGFLIAVTMQKWNLHRRIAMHILNRIGSSPGRIILGFMLATALLSMWISNTATTMMMLPIGIAVVSQVSLLQHDAAQPGTATSSDASRFGTCLMLGIAYSASIGGIATLIGTPPNAILAGMTEKIYGVSIGFLDWMIFGLPLSVVMLGITWIYLTRYAYPVSRKSLPGVNELIRNELDKLGKIRTEEISVLVVFLAVSIGWILRGLVDVPAMSMISDASIAIAGAVLLFIIPSNLAKREFLLDWNTAAGIPWDIIILFGGGFALAQGFTESGLSQWIADQLGQLSGVSIAYLIATVTLTVIFLTEVTSNTATATLMIPVLGALSTTMGMHPLALMVPAAVAASFAFMLPVATPPNAIVFSSRYITIPQMAKAGFLLNLAATMLISIFVLLLLPRMWGLDLSVPPESIPVIPQSTK